MASSSTTTTAAAAAAAAGLQPQSQSTTASSSHIYYRPSIIMNSWFYWIGISITILTAIIYCNPAFFYIFLFLLYSVIIVLFAIAGTIYVHFVLSSKSRQPQASHQLSSTLVDATNSSIFDLPKAAHHPAHLQIIFGRTVDAQLQQIIDYTIRDFIAPWLTAIVRQPKNLTNVLKEDLWNGIQKLRDRSVRIDAARIIAVDMCVRSTVHLEKIRIANARADETGQAPIFSTATYLSSEERELEFLRKLSEILIIFLLPRGYSLSPLKNFLSEILSYKIFYPLINQITSSDYINQKIVQYIESRLAVAAISKRCYEYAASFEDFLKIISAASGSIDDLQTIRTSIVNDLMQAQTLQNLQRAKGIDPDMDDSTTTKTLPKPKILAAIKLKKYIHQLTFAKAQCEKHLLKLGHSEIYPMASDLNLSMLDILSTVIGRRHFMLFLEPLKASGLIGFYTSVEELRQAPKGSYHQLGSEIFYTYIRAPSSEIKIDKVVRKRLESFLLGDVGTEVFFDVQKMVLRTLAEKYYSSFLASDNYQNFKNELTVDDFNEIAFGDIGTASSSSSDGSSGSGSSMDEQNMSGGGAANANGANGANNDSSAEQIDLQNYSTYAKIKLDQIQEKLDNKNQALEAIRESLKPESKLLIILEKEVNWLKMEKRQLEAHLTRTEIWGEHLGRWQATVQSVEAPDEKEPPKFMILVQVDENVIHSKEIIKNSKESNESISSGWVVLRSSAEFHELNRKLKPLSAELKNFDLPSQTFKIFFLKNDKSSLDKAKGQVQKYLNFILESENLCQSEAVYTFLSPSSEHLKNVPALPKKSKFSLATLFKTNNGTAIEPIKADPFWGPCGQRDGEEDISSLLDGTIPDATDANQKTTTASDANDAKDSIAEPLYALMGEVFDMGGVFKWLRRSLISFVQITYGRTINRQIRESILYLFEEPMLHHYAATALKTFWPGGQLNSTYVERSREQQEQTAAAAKASIIDNIPEIVCNLVGEQTAKHGAMKLFDAVQNSIYNKQLFYELIEILMLDIFPEIRQLKAITKPSMQTLSGGAGGTGTAATGGGGGMTTTF